MIISASRRCDIPSTYAQWLANRFEQGFVQVRNPYNHHAIRTVDLTADSVDAVVLWTKDASALFDLMGPIERFPFYVQWTINGYPSLYEQHIAPLQDRLDSFRSWARRYSPLHLVWRYDPIFLAPGCDVSWHKRTFSQIASSLSGCTDTVVISFLDLYRNIIRTCAALDIQVPTQDQMLEIAGNCSEIASQHGMQVVTCSEAIDLQQVGILHGACIDAHRLERLGVAPSILHRDPHQRPLCGCMASVDIGQYGTCPNGCVYCYANTHGSQKAMAHDPVRPCILE